MCDGAVTAPKSDVTNPANPHSPLRIVVRRGAFSQLYVPLTCGYAHITAPTAPSFTDVSKGAR